MRDYGDWNYLDVLRFAEADVDKSWTYIIMGRSGPTGKSYICDLLKRNGYHAIEISEDIITLVEYKDNKNHFLVNDAKKYVIVIRNRILSKYVDKWSKGE